MPSNRGTLFWLAYPGNLAPSAELYILAARETTFEAAIPGRGFSVTGTAGPGAPGIVSLPEDLAAVQSNEVIEQKGIRVTSERPVTVILRGGTVGTLSSTEAYLGLPVDMLGSEYFTVLGYQESVSARGFPGNEEPSQLTIAAVEDNTRVTVTPSCESLAGSQPGVPINLVLDQGEVWQYRCGFLRDVTGTRVRSNRPIAVFGGSRFSDVPPGVAFCDYLVEQLIPVELWDREYFVPPLLNGAANLVRVLASEDETWVQILTPRLFSRFHRFYSPPQYNINLVNIVAPVNAAVQLDGADVTGFSPFPGGRYQWAAVALDPGEHVISSTEPVMGYAYGFSPAIAYGYPTGLSIQDVDALALILIVFLLVVLLLLVILSQ